MDPTRYKSVVVCDYDEMKAALDDLRWVEANKAEILPPYDMNQTRPVWLVRLLVTSKSGRALHWLNADSNTLRGAIRKARDEVEKTLRMAGDVG